MNKKIMTVTEMRRLGKSCTYKVVELDDRDGFKSQSFSFEGCVFKHDWAIILVVIELIVLCIYRHFIK